MLKSDLQQALGVDEKEVMINQLTKHIKIKVHWFSKDTKNLLIDYWIGPQETRGSEIPGRS